MVRSRTKKTTGCSRPIGFLLLERRFPSLVRPSVRLLRQDHLGACLGPAFDLQAAHHRLVVLGGNPTGFDLRFDLHKLLLQFEWRSPSFRLRDTVWFYFGCMVIVPS